VATLERDDGSYLFTNPRVILEWAWDKYSAYDTALNDPGGSLYLCTLGSLLSHLLYLTLVCKATLSVGNQQEESAFSAQLRTMAGRLSGLQHVFQALLSRHDNTTKGQRNLEDKYQCVVHTLQVQPGPFSSLDLQRPLDSRWMTSIKQHLKVMMWVRAKIENWMFLGDSKTLQAQFQKRKDKRKEIHANTEQWLACQQVSASPQTDCECASLLSSLFSAAGGEEENGREGRGREQEGHRHVCTPVHRAAAGRVPERAAPTLSSP